MPESSGESREPRKRKHRHYDEQNLQEGIRGLLSGNDRTVAIVGGAFIEDLLEQLLRFHFVSDAKTLGELFGPEGPVGSFSAKIKLCYSLGLVGETGFKNLTRIKDIRNRFAHKIVMPNAKRALGRVSFETQQIADWCKALKFVDEDFVDSEDTPRKRFLKMCMVTAIYVSDHLMKAKRRPRRKKPVLP